MKNCIAKSLPVDTFLPLHGYIPSHNPTLVKCGLWMNLSVLPGLLEATGCERSSSLRCMLSQNVFIFVQIVFVLSVAFFLCDKKCKMLVYSRFKTLHSIFSSTPSIQSCHFLYRCKLNWVHPITQARDCSPWLFSV